MPVPIQPISDLTWFDVMSTAPEISIKLPLIPAITQNLILNTVNTMITEANWGNMTTQARVLYAAHMATLMRRKGLPGAGSSRSMGGISESFTFGTVQSSSFLSLTSYGQLYLSLAKTRAFRAGFTTGGFCFGKIGGFSG